MQFITTFLYEMKVDIILSKLSASFFTNLHPLTLKYHT